MTVEFEELMATKHTTPTEDLLFSLPVIAVSEIENSLDNTPPMSVRELDESVVQDHRSVQVKETPEDIQEPDDNVVWEKPEENTVIEVRKELVEVTEDGIEVIKEDISLVEIDGMTPTPNYLPSRITPTNLKYGRVYDYRHYGLPEDKDKEDSRQVLLCPPSTTTHLRRLSC
ncbi:unnamed protein product [Mytilus coruscus]|uniref:Uncharacterized protein n=1 Tax=Mytilus coruscus TaxID=42192 RepID=A0A6J8APN0_MYTCO|nr:unnamed protein product [Mytilus coruscus]